MNKVEIKLETLPSRCEICHQKDCFDALKNYCSRCSSLSPLNLEVSKVNSKGNVKVQKYAELSIKQFLSSAIIGSIVGFIFYSYLPKLNNNSEFELKLLFTFMGIVYGILMKEFIERVKCIAKAKEQNRYNPRSYTLFSRVFCYVYMYIKAILVRLKY